MVHLSFPCKLRLLLWEQDVSVLLHHVHLKVILFPGWLGDSLNLLLYGLIYFHHYFFCFFNDLTCQEHVQCRLLIFVLLQIDLLNFRPCESPFKHVEDLLDVIFINRVNLRLGPVFVSLLWLGSTYFGHIHSLTSCQ